jgi:hypothetical protein
MSGENLWKGRYGVAFLIVSAQPNPDFDELLEGLRKWAIASFFRAVTHPESASEVEPETLR